MTPQLYFVVNERDRNTVIQQSDQSAMCVCVYVCLLRGLALSQ